MKPEGQSCPDHILEMALSLQKTDGGDLDVWIKSVQAFEEAKRNSTTANPNEPVKANIRLISPKKPD